MKIIGVHNIKGGVGKTTTSVNLAWQIAREGWNVLLWDLDPQGASTYYFRIKSKIKGGGKTLLRKSTELMNHIRETDYLGLDLLPADFSCRNLDLYLDKHNNPEKRLGVILKPLQHSYDFIILDCPPSFSRLTESVYSASDCVLVPTIPTALSLRTLNQLSDYCDSVDVDANKLMPFFSMYDEDNPNHALIVDKLPPKRQTLLVTRIPLSSRIERTSLTRHPVQAQSPDSSESLTYARFWKEISHNLKRCS